VNEINTDKNINLSSDSLNAIAIIGMAVKLPNARTLDDYWNILKEGRETITFFSEEELLAAGVATNTIRRPDYVRARGKLDNIDKFDAKFFGVPPIEAQQMDPQHRMFLEMSWEALESAGYAVLGNGLSIGVYAGVSTNSYVLNVISNQTAVDSTSPFEALLGTEKDFLSTRVAYHLQLRGPAVTIQTACSTSLVATHLACQSLLSGETDIALAGGISVRCLSDRGYQYLPGGILSPDGHCRAFDAAAQGTVMGDGGGVVVLRRLSDALENHDPIHAIILGTATNNDAARKIGFVAPSIEGQIQVIQESLAISGINADTIGFVEAHGTGTRIGDPIEVAALAEVLRPSAETGTPIALGSVKTNVGHLDVAAGIVGLIKAALAIQHKKIPPTLHFSEFSKDLSFANASFFVNTQLMDWKEAGHPRRAGISSFGIGGTNAHAIIQEAPPRIGLEQSQLPQLLTISAKSPLALQSSIANLAREMSQKNGLAMQDIAHTLQVGRTHFDHRWSTVSATGAEAVEKLLERAESGIPNTEYFEGGERVAFMFPGQGSIRVGMGQQLYQSEQAFRICFDECARIAKLDLGLDIREAIFPDLFTQTSDDAHLPNPSVLQASLFSLEYSLAKLLISCGIQPSHLVGHSLGEYTAACLAGAITLESTLSLLAVRGNLIGRLPKGKMLVVMHPAENLASLLPPGTSIAAVNGPSNVVVSGTSRTIENFQAALLMRNIPCQIIGTSHAFHSAMMDPILSRFAEHTEACSYAIPKLPYFSCVSGRWSDSSNPLTGEYWVRHLRETVNFANVAELLFREGVTSLVEVGPSLTICNLVREQANSNKFNFLPTLPEGNQSHSEKSAILETCGALWERGNSINWKGLENHANAYKVHLPTHPFDRQSYWLDDKSVSLFSNSSGTHLKSEENWYYQPSWVMCTPKLVANPLPGAQIWIVFSNEQKNDLGLATHLRKAGQSVVCVTPGSRHKFSELSYQVNYDSYADISYLISELFKNVTKPIYIAHTGYLSLDGHDKREAYFFSLLTLTQAIGRLEHANQVTLLTITRNAFRVTGDEDQLSPNQALAIGPALVAAQEQIGMKSYAIDIRQRADDPSHLTESEFRAVLQIACHSFKQSIFALRNERLWAQSFCSIDLTTPIELPHLLREGRTYLVTGGLGGIGLLFCQFLAKRVHGVNLAILSRRPAQFPDRTILDGGDEANRQRTEAKIATLRALGATVLYIQADASDLDVVTAARKQIEKEFGKVDGVFHAAGVMGKEFAQHLSATSVHKTFAPKILGADVINAVFWDSRFLIFCSSTSAFLGGVGFADYCSANAYMDCLAHSMQGLVAPLAISVNWHSWAPFEGTASAAVSPVKSNSLIYPENADDCFAAILNNPRAQIVVCPTDLEALRRQVSLVDYLNFSKTQVDATRERKVGRAPPGTTGGAFSAPGTKTEIALVRILSDLFGISEVGIDDDFFELGGHSLLAIKLATQLRHHFDLDLSLTKLLEGPTIRAIAAYIDSSHQEAQEQYLRNLSENDTDRQVLAELLSDVEQTKLPFEESNAERDK
jgi:phthiocerol/phenolphthiocerol synthesis type-I polyketide synthase E